jgi:hypothetical protein
LNVATSTPHGSDTRWNETDVPDSGRSSQPVNAALQEKGIDRDLRKIKADDIEQLLEALGEPEVAVESSREKVRVYVD